MAPERIQSVIAQYFAATRAMDLEAWVACFAENATSYEPAAPAPLQGHTALRQLFLGIAGAFQKVGMTEDHVFVSGAASERMAERSSLRESMYSKSMIAARFRRCGGTGVRRT